MAAAISSCCKEQCIEQYLNTTYVNFNETEIDTIVTRIYERNTGFASPVDSSITILSTVTIDTLHFSLSNNIQLDKDIELFFPSTGDKYQLTDFETRREDCNCGNQTRKEITGYTLDGINHTGNDIYIVKR